MADVLEVDLYANGTWILVFDGRVLEIFGKRDVSGVGGSGWDADGWRVHVRQLTVKVTGPNRKGLREVAFCSPANPAAFKSTFELNDKQWSRVQPLLDALGNASTPAAPASASGGMLASKISAFQALISQHDVRLSSQPEDVRNAVAREEQAAGIQVNPDSLAITPTDPGQVDALLEIYKRHLLLPPDATLD
jgi:hypothetical protein